MVSILKMNACMQAVKQSKYSDSTPGRPICSSGTGKKPKIAPDST